MKLKRIFLAVLISGLTGSLFSAEYKQLPFKQKVQAFTKAAGGEDLKLFGVTFDNLTLHSDWSRGRGRAGGVKDINLALRGVQGFDTRNAYRAEPDEDLKYPALHNVDPHKGTLMFWVCGMDYNPGDRFTNGKKRPNIALSELRFGDGKEHISIKIYEFNGCLAALWSSSAAPEVKGLSAIAVCETRIDFKRNQYFHVAVSWDSSQLSLYVNGQKRVSAALPAKSSLTSKLKMKAEDSFIGIRSKFYDDDHRFSTAVDDVLILKRPLSEIELGNYYNSLVKGGSAAYRAFYVNFNGVEDLSGKIDKLEAVFDLSGLNNAERKQLNDGKLPCSYILKGPDGKIISSGALPLRSTSDSYIFKKVDKPGKYTVDVSIGKHKDTFTVTRPDFSFLGNKIGAQNTVPEVFRDFSVSGRKVQLWQKSYTFGEGPLPEKIMVFGKSLLTKAPELKLDDRKIVWKAGKTIRTATNVTYTGTGKAKDCTIDYKTTVEYDGLINFHFTVNGQPVVKSMTLDWQVRKDAAEFLLTPALKPEGKSSFVFPISKLDSQLWLAGDGTGGFCWTAEHDANWVSNDREHVLYGDTGTGKCLVKMITKEVKLPEKVEYSSLFIATPTRPLKVRKRFNAYGGFTRYKHSINFTGADHTSSAFISPFDIRPSKYAGIFWDKAREKSLRPYNAAESGTVKNPQAAYLQKYGEIPGEYSYNMQHYKVISVNPLKQVREHQKSISFCSRTYINDFLMYTNKVLLDSKWGSKIGQFNYDLAANTPCANPYHGCLFKDRFGRYIKTFVVLPKRDLMMRTLRLAHSRGVTLSLHAQNRFNPVLHGMGDIWSPGEQHCAALKTNPFALIDGSADERLFRSEYNRDVIGTGIEMSMAIAQLNRKNYDIPEATVAGITMMLLYDIDFPRGWTAYKVTFKVWDIFQKYDFGNPAVEAHKFYRQKEVKSSNPKVQIIWYELPGKWKLFAVCNRQKTAQKTVIDFGRTLPANCKVREEYFKKNFVVKDGKLEVTVPPRAFLLIGAPAVR